MTVGADARRAEQIETAIRKLRGVDRVKVVLDAAGDVREVHISTVSDRRPKNFVRDVQSVMLTHFGKSLDHRFIQVAYEIPEGAAPAPVPPAPSPAPAPAPAPAPVMSGEPAPARTADRIRFGSVNLYVSGPRAQAQVELRWKGMTRMGSATGTATRDGAHLLVASATVAALEQFLEEDWSLGVTGVQFVRLGPVESVVVGLALLAHRREKTLAGCCTVEQDVPQAVALATLAALNRVVGGLETREPIEYVLRPTSSREASEARDS